MQWKHSLAAAGLALSVGIAAADTTGQAFKDVPRDHWGYAAMTCLEQAGITTGYPEGTFTGKRLLTRYEFAVALQRVARAAAHPTATGGPSGNGRLRAAVLRKLGLDTPQLPEGLPRLVTEFTPELKLLGAEPVKVAANLEPEGAEPLDAGALVAALGKQSASYRDGVREADAEWKKGDVTFYTAGMPSTPYIDRTLGIPHYGVAGCIVDQSILSRMAGHNDQVHRLILENGLPTSAKRIWLSVILKPEEAWRSATQPPVALRFDRSEAVSPDGTLRLRLKSAPEDQSPKLLGARNGAPFGVNLYHLDRQHPKLEVQWGPKGSDLLFVRYSQKEPGTPDNLAVLDSRTGRLLNVVYNQTKR